MSNDSRIDTLVSFYESLSVENLANFADFYAEDAYFKDPFNEVRGVEPIRRIFTHMFDQVAEPRFVVSERVVQGASAVLVWEFHYRVKFWGQGQAQSICGVSHLKFDAEGKVVWHRDYWDAAEELYSKLPVVGALMRGLKKMVAS
ncbi:MAG: nuclear transport factor 2 family protein [Betaproteobacteria bacterium]